MIELVDFNEVYNTKTSQEENKKTRRNKATQKLQKKSVVEAEAPAEEAPS